MALATWTIYLMVLHSNAWQQNHLNFLESLVWGQLLPRGRAPYSSSKRSQHTKKIRKTTNRGCKIVQFKHQTIKHIWQKWVASCVCCEANRRQQRQRWNTSREKTLSVCRLLQSCTGRKALMLFAWRRILLRYFDFPCDTWEYIYHTNYGFFTSKRKTDDNDKLVVAPNL